MMEVRLSTSLRQYVGGATSIAIEASTIRELLRKLVERHPKLQSQLDQQAVAVSINGEIFRDDRNVTIPDGAEVYLLPRIPGG